MKRPRMTLSVFLGALALSLSAVGLVNQPSGAAERSRSLRPAFYLANLQIVPAAATQGNHVNPAAVEGNLSHLAADVRHSTGLELAKRINLDNDGVSRSYPVGDRPPAGAAGASAINDPRHSTGLEVARRINEENDGLGDVPIAGMSRTPTAKLASVVSRGERRPAHLSECQSLPSSSEPAPGLEWMDRYECQYGCDFGRQSGGECGYGYGCGFQYGLTKAVHYGCDDFRRHVNPAESQVLAWVGKTIEQAVRDLADLVASANSEIAAVVVYSSAEPVDEIPSIEENEAPILGGEAAPPVEIGPVGRADRPYLGL